MKNIKIVLKNIKIYYTINEMKRGDKTNDKA